MERSNKNLIIQVLWIIAIGIILYFFYNGQNAKQEVQKTETTQDQKADYSIEAKCMEIAAREANEIEKFLTEVVKPSFPNSDEKVQQAIEDTKNKEYRECMDIWGN